ncbi:uncharacterized protein SCHCODRAFT_02581163 [Schizophyllum commune H4-8]|uniref:Expressed protein n=1 Tax=Schizophyllum commune (strain H4-8 / FGSC 9210) TaxID=578458 RepID=D8Q7L8_SCHCM|nr:uncharacterized protein SCHCODRAFT_02581163 [Schizophyllum commune H4-8]KAI5891434.1 hypothetical protein SCHCODRAFT_02581163 [Schizophyllum commune H4-8]
MRHFDEYYMGGHRATVLVGDPPRTAAGKSARSGKHKTSAQDIELARQTKLCSHYCRNQACPEGEENCDYIHDKDIYAAQMSDPASGLQRHRAPRAHCWAYIQGSCPRRGTCRYYHPQKRELYCKYTPCANWRECTLRDCTFRHPAVVDQGVPSPVTTAKRVSIDAGVKQDTLLNLAQAHALALEAYEDTFIRLTAPSPPKSAPATQTHYSRWGSISHAAVGNDFEAMESIQATPHHGRTRRASAAVPPVPRNQQRYTVEVKGKADSSMNWRDSRRSSVY